MENPQKAASSVYHLPTEVLASIFQYCASDVDPVTIGHLRLVCTHWYAGTTCFLEALLSNQMVGDNWVLQCGYDREACLFGGDDDDDDDLGVIVPTCNRLGFLHLKCFSPTLLEQIKSIDASHWGGFDDATASLFMEGVQLTRSVFGSGNSEKLDRASLSLKSLILAETKVTHATGCVIGRAMPQLEVLSFASCKITDLSISEISLRCSELQSLDLSRCTRLTGASVKALSNIQSLTSLNLSECSKATAAGSVRELRALTNLVELNLAACQGINDLNIQTLSSMPSLRKLSLENCQGTLTPNGAMKALTRISSLTTLSLALCDWVTDVGLEQLANPMSVLCSLSLRACNNVTDAGVAALARLPLLASLDLTRCSGLTVFCIGPLATLPSLEVLNLSGCYFLGEPKDTKCITVLATAPKLLSLDMQYNSISDDALRDFANAFAANKGSRLRRLNLSGSVCLSAQGVCSLRTMPHLRELDVSCCELTEKEVAVVATQLPFVRSLIH
jgi:hypothetical protein